MVEHDDDRIGPRRPIHGFFKDIATCEPELPVWLIENVLAKGLTFVGGPPKSGKSTLTAAIAALVAGFDCRAMPEFMSRVSLTGPVLWLSAEANGGELRFILEEGMGTKLEDNGSLLVADDPWEFRLDDPDGWKRLHEWLIEIDPRLCIIDPLAEFHELDEKSAGDMVRLLRPVRKWAVDHDSAVLVVHHTSKKPADRKEEAYDALDMRGSSALFGKADGVIMMTPVGEESASKSLVKTIFKRAKGWNKQIQWAIWDHRGKRAGVVLPDLAKKISVLLSLGPQTPKDIALQLDTGPTAVKNALEAMEDNKMVVREKDTWVLKKK
jgi:hypothetical protein